jgi:adenylate cyclase class 2
MAVEIEAKMKVDSFDAVQKILRGSGTPQGSELETNIFFDTIDGALRKGDQGLRLRIAFNEKGRKKCTVTFKGPLQKGELKTREEIEFTVNNPAAVTDLFAKLGYREAMSFEKRRESWTFEKCEIALDELPHLGKFVEVEGDTGDQVMAARKGLGLDKTELISRGYISMLADYIREHNIADHHIRL